MSKLRKFLIIDLILLMAVLGALTISKILKYTRYTIITNTVIYTLNAPYINRI